MVEDNTKIELYNPVELIKNMYGIEADHIIFDKDIKPEYHIIRESSHDGTLLFTTNLISHALENLLNGISYYKKTEPGDWSKVKGMKYILGELKLETTFGMVDLKAGRHHGQTDIVSIPVKCEYIY